MKKDIICGYPNPTTEQIKTFQKNNQRDADGLIGPKTRSAIWREREHNGMYTHLIDYPLRDHGAIGDRDILRDFLQKNIQWERKLNLHPDALVTLFGILSSNWKTG